MVLIETLCFICSDENVGELPQHGTELLTTENGLNRLKSLAHLRMAEPRKSGAADSMTREELEALKDLLDKTLQKYQNHDAYPVTGKRRPNDPYIGQILQNLNGAQRPASHHNDQTISKDDKHDDFGHNNDNDHRFPVVRRKIIRHTVFATPYNAPNRMYGQDSTGFNRIRPDSSTRIEWSSPWADYFPILIKDPFQTMMNSFSEIIEYGPEADICRHGAADANPEDQPENSVRRKTRMSGARPDALKRSRRNTAGPSATDTDDSAKGVLLNHVRPLRPHGVMTTTTERPKMYHWATEKTPTEHNGDTGPQIKRLVVRKGGVAIAGPGGIATAGSGGTAIVGPGGSAYSSKDTASGATADSAPGVSLAGHGPNVVQGPQPTFYNSWPQQQHYNGYGRSVNVNDDDGGNRAAVGTALLSSDGVAYTFPVPSRGLTVVGGRSAASTASTGTAKSYAASTAREIILPDGAKLIATGPIVYYNPEPSTPRKKSRKGKKEAKRRVHLDDDDDSAASQSY